MSRYPFHKALTTPTEEQEELADLIGYDLFDWVNVGVIGYDESLETFFFNMEGSWLFGTEHREIPSIHIFQAIFSAMFKGAEIPFNIEGLERIVWEEGGRPAVLDPEDASDLSMQISKSYLDEKVSIAKAFREAK